MLARCAPSDRFARANHEFPRLIANWFCARIFCLFSGSGFPNFFSIYLPFRLCEHLACYVSHYVCDMYVCVVHHMFDRTHDFFSVILSDNFARIDGTIWSSPMTLRVKVPLRDSMNFSCSTIMSDLFLVFSFFWHMRVSEWVSVCGILLFLFSIIRCFVCVM